MYSNLLKKFSLWNVFFLYEKFQSQVGNKVVCQEMDPYSKPFYSFHLYIFLKKKRGKCQNIMSQNFDDKCRLFCRLI